MGFTGSEAKYANFDFGVAGNNTAVAAVTGAKIRVLAVTLFGTGGLNTVRFEDGAGGTALTGQMAIASKGQINLPFSPVGWFETSAGTLLNIELSDANAVAGVIVYVEV